MRSHLLLLGLFCSLVAHGQRIYAADGSYLARVEDGRTYDASGSFTGRNDVGRIYASDGSYLARLDGDRVYDASGSFIGCSEGVPRRDAVLFFFWSLPRAGDQRGAISSSGASVCRRSGRLARASL